MPLITTIPQELMTALGSAATDKLVDLLNSSFSVQKEDVIAVNPGPSEPEGECKKQGAVSRARGPRR